MKTVTKYIAALEGESLKTTLDHYDGLDVMADTAEQAIFDLEEGLPDFADDGQKYYAVKITFEKHGEEKVYNEEN